MYLPWLRGKLEAAGVKFVRAEVASLKEAANLAPGELVVNATGNGAKFLMDVADQDCVQVRGQTMLVRCAAPDIHIRHALRWDEYTYVLPRGDGTAIMGGIKEFGSIDPIVNEELKRKVGGARPQVVGSALTRRSTSGVTRCCPSMCRSGSRTSTLSATSSESAQNARVEFVSRRIALEVSRSSMRMGSRAEGTSTRTVSPRPSRSW